MVDSVQSGEEHVSQTLELEREGGRVGGWERGREGGWEGAREGGREVGR